MTTRLNLGSRRSRRHAARGCGAAARRRTVSDLVRFVRTRRWRRPAPARRVGCAALAGHPSALRWACVRPRSWPHPRPSGRASPLARRARARDGARLRPLRRPARRAARPLAHAAFAGVAARRRRRRTRRLRRQGPADVPRAGDRVATFARCGRPAGATSSASSRERRRSAAPSSRAAACAPAASAVRRRGRVRHDACAARAGRRSSTGSAARCRSRSARPSGAGRPALRPCSAARSPTRPEELCALIASLARPLWSCRRAGVLRPRRERLGRGARRSWRSRRPATRSCSRAAGTRRTSARPGLQRLRAHDHSPAMVVNGLVGGYPGRGRQGRDPVPGGRQGDLPPGPRPGPRQGLPSRLRLICARGRRPQRRRLGPPARARSAGRRAPSAPGDDRGSESVRVRVRTPADADPALGRHVPIVDHIQRFLGTPVVLMGFALPDDRMHAPNERFPTCRYAQSDRRVDRFLAEAGRRVRATDRADDHRLPLPRRPGRRPQRALGHRRAALDAISRAARRPGSTDRHLRRLPLRLRRRQPRRGADRRRATRPLLRLCIRARRTRPGPDRRAGRRGRRGVRLPRHQSAPPRRAASRARSARSHARWGLPILYDVMGEVATVELLAREYPDVEFIIPHLGSFADDWRAQLALIDQLVRHPNVYTDTSGVRRFDLLSQAVRARRAGQDPVRNRRPVAASRRSSCTRSACSISPRRPRRGSPAATCWS